MSAQVECKTSERTLTYRDVAAAESLHTVLGPLVLGPQSSLAIPYHPALPVHL